MGPYRTNAAPLRARREELRLELADLAEKITELAIARDCVERSIDDIDVKLQTDFRPPRRRRTPGRGIVLVFAGAVAGVSALLLLAVALESRHAPRCVVTSERSVVIDGFSDVRSYP